MPVKGTVDYDLSHEAWKTIEGRLCYIQRTVLFRPDSISFPKKYLKKLPCLVSIDQRYKKGPNKGMKMFPDLYVLREHMILNKKLRLIQRKKCYGWIIPISELDKHKR